MLNKLIAMVVLLLLCSACSKLEKKYGEYKPDRNEAYLKQEEVVPLKLPSGYSLDSHLATDRYPVPHGPRPKPGTEPVSIVPPTLTSTVEEPQDAES